MTLVVIDDDQEFLDVLFQALSETFNVKTFSRSDRGLDFIRNNPVDAVLLDLHMPRSNGFDVYKEIKEFNNSLPVIFFTGDPDISVRIKGLTIGADDFLIKPVAIEELTARIKNRIRASQRIPEAHKIIEIKGLYIDLDSHIVKVDGNTVYLTPKEYELLIILCQNQNRVIKKETLIDQLWKDVHVESNNLDTHFSNLRRKLKPFSSNIKTLKNLGYVLRT